MSAGLKPAPDLRARDQDGPGGVLAAPSVTGLAYLAYLLRRDRGKFWHPGDRMPYAPQDPSLGRAAGGIRRRRLGISRQGRLRFRSEHEESAGAGFLPDRRPGLGLGM